MSEHTSIILLSLLLVDAQHFRCHQEARTPASRHLAFLDYIVIVAIDASALYTHAIAARVSCLIIAGRPSSSMHKMPAARARWVAFFSHATSSRCRAAAA